MTIVRLNGDLHIDPDDGTSCTVSNFSELSGILENMAEMAAKFAIERRRSEPPENSVVRPLNHNQPKTRRESDLVRQRIQHWMELADTALRRDKLPAKHRRAVR